MKRSVLFTVKRALLFLMMNKIILIAGLLFTLYFTLDFQAKDIVGVTSLCFYFLLCIARVSDKIDE